VLLQCLLTIPALVYLTAVPMWSRVHKFAKSYAFAALDIVFTVWNWRVTSIEYKTDRLHVQILWLSAFAGLIAWTHDGIKRGAAEAKIPYDQANCTTFAFGEEAKCKLAYSTLGVGVVIL
jgi:hypothetical protein